MQRRDRKYSITANTNFVACVLETIGTAAVGLLHHSGISNLTLWHSMYILCHTTFLIINFHYITLDDAIKDIIVHRGWIVGFCSIFQTNARRQSMLQTIRDEVRAEIRKNAGMAPLPFYKKPTEVNNKKASKKYEQNATSSFDEDYLCFKMFYRQLAIKRLLKKNYETDPLQFELELENFVELEKLCIDNQYHFDNGLFHSSFEEFVIHKRDGRVPPNETGNPIGRGNNSTSLATLIAQPLLQKSNHNGKIILQGMLNNVDNEDIFAALFEQLHDEQVRYDMPINRGSTDENQSMNMTSCRNEQAKTKHSKVKKSNTKTKRTSRKTVMLPSETFNDSEAHINKIASDYSIHCRTHDDELDLADKNERVESTTTNVTDQFCSLNVPVY